MSEPQRQFEREYRSYSPIEGFGEENIAVVTNFPARLEQDQLRLVEQARRALQIGFLALPLLAGLDKFVYELVDWTAYLSPFFPRALGIRPESFLHGIGILEVTLAVGIAARSRLFADLFSSYMILCAVNLMILGGAYHLVLFSLCFAAGAYALARLTKAKEKGALASVQATTFGGPWSDQNH